MFIHSVTHSFYQQLLHKYCRYLRSGNLRKTSRQVSRTSLGGEFSDLLSYHSVSAGLDEIRANPVGSLQGQDNLPHPQHFWSSIACWSRGRSKIRMRVRDPRAGTLESRIKDPIVSSCLRSLVKDIWATKGSKGVRVSLRWLRNLVQREVEE